MPEAGDPLTLVPKPQERPNTHVRWHARTHASACTFTYSLARSPTHSETSFSRSTSLAVLHTHTLSLSLSAGNQQDRHLSGELHFVRSPEGIVASLVLGRFVVDIWARLPCPALPCPNRLISCDE